MMLKCMWLACKPWCCPASPASMGRAGPPADALSVKLKEFGSHICHQNRRPQFLFCCRAVCIPMNTFESSSFEHGPSWRPRLVQNRWPGSLRSFARLVFQCFKWLHHCLAEHPEYDSCKKLMKAFSFYHSCIYCTSPGEIGTFSLEGAND